MKMGVDVSWPTMSSQRSNELMSAKHGAQKVHSGDAQPMLIHSGFSQYSSSLEENPRRNTPDSCQPQPLCYGSKCSSCSIYVLPEKMVVAPAGSYQLAGQFLPTSIISSQLHIQGTSCWLSEIGYGRTVYTMAIGNATHQSSHPGPVYLLTLLAYTSPPSYLPRPHPEPMGRWLDIVGIPLDLRQSFSPNYTELPQQLPCSHH